MTDVKGLKERLEAILVEESPMHPFGCAAWEEESREAIDSALAYIADLEARVDSLTGYAVHDDDCTVNRYPGHDACSCGLSAILQKARREAALNTIGDEHG